jgi:hypothetical protein
MNTPSFSPENYRGPNSIKISDSHRLTRNLTEILVGNNHIIRSETEGYSGDPVLIDSLVDAGIVLLQHKTGNEVYEYHGNGFTSLRGFLNSTKADSRGSIKRQRVIEKISDSIDNLSHDHVAVSFSRDATYHDIALDTSSNPVILPTGAIFRKYQNYGEAHARNSVVSMQIASSILAVLGSSDNTPFNGLVR